MPGTLRTRSVRARAGDLDAPSPALTVPVTSVTRINGQCFAFVAEPGEGRQGPGRARQRAVQLGPVVGNNYMVLSGLKAGEKLIVGRHPEDRRRRAGAPPPRLERRSARRHGSGGRVMITDVFIRRPVLATVCSILITLAGAIAIPTLPIGRYPELAPPTVAVGAFYTGANAQAVESAVTTPLEIGHQRRRGHDLHDLVEHQQRASATITVTFEVGRDPDLAAVDVQNRVNSALGRMPLEVRTNGITVTQEHRRDSSAALGFYSDDNRYDSLFISNYLDRYVRDALKRVPGVGNVIIFGERRFAMRLWLDPNRLAGRGLTAGDVTNALREQNVQVAAGIGRRAAVVRRSDVPAQRARGRPADRGDRSSKTSSSRPARTARSCA